MSSRHGFFCIGCWTVDRIKHIDTWPAEETLANILATERQGGGSAHNLGVDIRHLDPTMPVYTAGVLGNDENGDYLQALASLAGIEATQLHRVDHVSTSYTDVMSVQGTGKRTFFHHTGSNDCLQPEHVDFEAVPARVAHLGLLGLHGRLDEGEDNGWVTLLRRARAAGMQTNIELVSIAEDRLRNIALPCLPHLDTLVVNDYEIGCLAGMATLKDGAAVPQLCSEAARRIHAQSTAELIVVHYPAGAVCITSDGAEVNVPACGLPASHVVGSVGAGDAFAAGFLYGIHQGWSIIDALQLAHGAAALSLGAATATDGVLGVSECIDFARIHGVPGHA